MEVIDDVKQLSERLMPPPLKEGEQVVFKLCNVGKKEIGREEPSAPEVVQISAKESIIDPFELDPKNPKEFKPVKKTMGTFVEENRIVNGVMVAKYKAPQFIRGYCTVASDDPGTYVRMMRSKHNTSNKFRKKMGKCKDIFMLVEDKKEVQDQLQIHDLRWQAETIVRKGEWDSLKTIAHALNQSPDTRLHVQSYRPGIIEDLQGMKLELIQKATLYPKQVIALSDNIEAKLQVQIFDAINFGVIVFDNDAYNLFDEKGGFHEVHKPDVGSDKMQSLLKYLMSAEGKNDYGQLIKALKKALKG